MVGQPYLTRSGKSTPSSAQSLRHSRFKAGEFTPELLVWRPAMMARRQSPTPPCAGLREGARPCRGQTICRIPHVSCGKIGTNRKQFLQCLFGSLAHTLLPAHGRSHCVSKEISRHIHSESEVKRASVVALAIRAIGVGKPVPPGMLRVELHREFHECAAVVPVTRIGDQAAHKGSRGRVHAIQCDCPLGYWTRKARKSFWKKSVEARLP